MSIKGKFIFPSGAERIITEASNTKITAHFTIGELANNSAPEAVKFILNKKVLIHADMLEQLRMRYGKPLVVNSWYRTASYNKRVGGISTSNHLKGTATDLKVACDDALWDKFVKDWKLICSAHGVAGEIIRYDTFIHVGSQISYAKDFRIYDKRKK